MRCSQVVICSGLILSTSIEVANASSFTRTVRSGQATRIAAYHSWDPLNCKSLSATMNVLTKPSHGQLIPRVVNHTITQSRYGSVGDCYGKPIKALQVDYKSVPGYKGTDTFSIDVKFGWQDRRDTDNYTVSVQ